MISHLATLDDMSQHLETMIPMQVLIDIENSRNPMLLTKERLERAATENQFMNGKIQAIDVSQSTLQSGIRRARVRAQWQKRADEGLGAGIQEVPGRSADAELP